MTTRYQSFVFQNAPVWEQVPIGAIGHFHWEQTVPYRPNSFFQFCFVKHKGVFVRLWSDEEHPRAVCTARDEPVYEDSCLECFFAPSPDTGYFNFEMNPNGVLLSQFGKGREGRVFLKELTEKAPVVTAFQPPAGWGVELFVPCELFAAVTHRPFDAEAGEYRGCCFKCGDRTARPHYGSFAPMGSLPPGFHNPACFATFELKEFQHDFIQKAD